MASNLTTKGQVTVPKKVRDYLGLNAGAPVTFNRLGECQDSCRVIKRPPVNLLEGD